MLRDYYSTLSRYIGDAREGVLPSPPPPPPPRSRRRSARRDVEVVPGFLITSLGKSGQQYRMAADQPAQFAPHLVKLVDEKYGDEYIARRLDSRDLKRYLEAEFCVHIGATTRRDWPGSPRVIDLGVYSSYHSTYFVVFNKWPDTVLSEFVGGCETGVLHERGALRFLLEMATAVSLFHRSGFVHLDLHLGRFHVRTDRYGNTRVGLLSYETARPKHSKAPISPAGMRHPAPELLYMARHVDGTSVDAYALGGCLYDMLTGKNPSPCSGGDTTDMSSDSSDSPLVSCAIDLAHPALEAAPAAAELLRELVERVPARRLTVGRLQTKLEAHFRDEPLPFFIEHRPPFSTKTPKSAIGKLLWTRLLGT